MNKKIFCLILVMATIFNLFTFPVLAAATLKLNVKSVTLGVSETYQAKATTNSKKTVTWTTSNSSIATVDKTGLITAKKKGSAIITVGVDGAKAEINVTVKKAPENLFWTEVWDTDNDNIFTQIGMSNSVDVWADESPRQIWVILPKDTASKEMTFKSSDTSIATVDKNGLITGVKRGECTVSVTAFNGKGIEIKVTVNPTSNHTGSSGNDAPLIKIGNWNYYAFQNDKFLYRIYDNKTVGEQIIADKVKNIKFIGNWIYYSKIENDGNERPMAFSIPVGEIYKIRTDGTKNTKITSDKSSNFEVSGDWIYYQNDSDNSYLYKMRIDGTEKSLLSEDKITSGIYGISVKDEWIYYSVLNGSYGWPNWDNYKICTDGTGREKI